MRPFCFMVALLLALNSSPIAAEASEAWPWSHQADSAVRPPLAQWAAIQQPASALPALEDTGPPRAEPQAPHSMAPPPDQSVTTPRPETAPPGQPTAPLQPRTAAEHPAPAPPGLTLEELVDIAMESNPTLTQATADVQAAEGRYVQASLYPNPQISYIGVDMGLEGTAGQQGMGFSQEIVTTNKRAWATAVAESQIQQARFAWESQRRRVVNGIRSGYYDVLLAQRTIDVNEELVKIGRQGVELTKKRLAARSISKAELLQTQIEAQMAELSLNQARNHYDAAWRRLTAVLGNPEMHPQRLAGEVDKDLPQFDWQNTLDHLLTQSPELAQAFAAVETARNQVALQCANRIPNFQVGTAVTYAADVYDTLSHVEVTVPLPVFNRNQGNIMAAQSNLAAAQNEVQRVELNLRNRLAQSFEQYANASRQVDVYSDSIVPNAQESLRLAAIGYRAGEFGYLTLLTAQRTYFGVSLEYLESLRQFWAQSVELEGMLLSGGLQRPE